MLEHDAQLILRDVYASWEDGDIPTTLSYFADSVIFAVHSTPEGESLVGAGLGRDNFGGRLDLFQRAYEVVDFKLLHVTTRGLWVQSRALYRYRHRTGGMEVDGTMRHLWRFVGDEIAHFELFHDAPRMRAFYAMTAQ
jgi:ketosteroid isomerase-like protein